MGVMPPYEGVRLAREKGLDLVEIAAKANPPVCRIVDYGKHLYQLNTELSLIWSGGGLCYRGGICG